MKICLIDDNQEIANTLSKMLRINGHECVTVNDGRSGLSLIENDKFDAVLLDVSMPEFSGIDVVNALNESNKIKENNIVILTASSISHEELDKLKEQGVKAVLEKPIQLNSLISTLEAVTKSE